MSPTAATLRPSRTRALHAAARGLAAVLLCLLFGTAAAVRGQQQGGGQTQGPQKYTREGVTVEFSVEPVARGKAAGLLEGSEATVRFRITEDNTGRPLGNLRPAAWVSLRRGGPAPDAGGCRQKVQSFLQASLAERPEIDLNSYFILTLNQEPNISVIDPLLALGTTKLYTLVALASPGEDWVMSGDKKRLYVSMPQAGQVAVVDTVTWKVLANVEAGAKPGRVRLQHDERYLWVANGAGADDGVTVIDTAALKVAARVRTGAGPHEIALSDDDRYAFVTNRQGGTLSVIDVRKLAAVAEVRTGALPSALAFSPLSKAVYVAHEGDGTIAAVGATRHEVIARMKAAPGLRDLRLMPGGRFGFAVNRAANSVHIFDVSDNRLMWAVPVGPSPDQVVFSTDFAYVRSTGNEFVTMINVRGLGKEGYEPAVNRFPAGQKAPRESPSVSLADSLVRAPDEGAVLVANPADKMIYFYKEGMAAPMGSFQNYRRDPRAVLVLNNSLSETAPGVYTTTVRLGARGQYDVAFLLDAPRMVNCFPLAVGENPELPRRREVAVKVEPVAQDEAPRVGEPYRLRFKVTDPDSGKPKELTDVGVLVFLAPGIWQQQEWARQAGGGLYEVTFTPPQEGVYYVFFEVPSLGVKYTQSPYLTLQASKHPAGPGATQP